MAFACAVWLVVAPRARASDPPKILLLHSQNPESRMVRRLHAEFTNLGIAVLEVPDETTDDAGAFLTEAARREGAFAAVRIVSDGRATTVWVADRLTDKILVRALPASRTGVVGGEVVALEVVELLRASLLELNVPEPSRPSSPPEVAALLGPAEAAPRAERPSRFHAQIAPTVLAAPGGVGPTGHASVGLRYQWTPRLSSRAFVVLPVVAGNVRGPGGRAEVGVGLAGMGLDLALTHPASDWMLLVGGAVAAARIRTVGTSESLLLERADTVYSVVPALLATIQRRLSGRTSLGFEVMSGISVPRPIILFGERETAHWGRPLLGASLTLDLALD